MQEWSRAWTQVTVMAVDDWWRCQGSPVYLYRCLYEQWHRAWTPHVDELVASGVLTLQSHFNNIWNACTNSIACHLCKLLWYCHCVLVLSVFRVLMCIIAVFSVCLCIYFVAVFHYFISHVAESKKCYVVTLWHPNDDHNTAVKIARFRQLTCPECRRCCWRWHADISTYGRPLWPYHVTYNAL